MPPLPQPAPGLLCPHMPSEGEKEEEEEEKEDEEEEGEKGEKGQNVIYLIIQISQGMCVIIIYCQNILNELLMVFECSSSAHDELLPFMIS